MTIDAINSTGAGQAVSSASSALSSAVSQTSDQFMMILLAQLKNQNPLEPMKDNEMMTQMTQLNSLQELQAIQASMEQLAAASSAGYAASLIGKNVRALLPDGTNVEGLVTGTTFRQGLYLINVGDQMIPLSSILEVSQPEPPVEPEPDSLVAIPEPTTDEGTPVVEPGTPDDSDPDPIPPDEPDPGSVPPDEETP